MIAITPAPDITDFVPNDIAEEIIREIKDKRRPKTKGGWGSPTEAVTSRDVRGWAECQQANDLEDGEIIDDDVIWRRFFEGSKF